MALREMTALSAAIAAGDPQRRTAKALILGALLVGIVSAIVFSVFPDLDLAVSRPLLNSDHHFSGRDSLSFGTARLIFNVLFYAACAIGLVGCVITLSTGRRWLTLSSNKWLFLAVCVVVGPLAIANLGFKDHWGRARPSTVVEFGGSRAYTPPLVKSQECPRNCSFFSGEASSIFVVCFAAALMFPTVASAWIVAGLILGSLCGFVRMAEGGHFLSDVIFAGVFMALTVAIIQMLFSAISGNSEPV